jgi:hypothetical protein
MAHSASARIEIFRPGAFVDASGRARDFSADALARIAASYDPKLKSAPLTRGHKPTSGEAALGWVAALAFSDGKLHADIDQLDALFAGAVTRRIKGRL